MDKIVKFVECLVPISNCNLRCSYCYVIQENRRDLKTSPFRCSPKEIGKAFDVKRWGGKMLVNLCGFGETLIPKEMPQIIYNILLQGHYVNVTNNGTMSNRFDEIVAFPSDMLDRLCFAFSLHYMELKQRDLLDVFVNNVNKVKAAGCSILIQLNLCDEYIECLDEIKQFCMDNFGCLPQVALTRKEGNGFEILTNKSDEEYMKIGDSFRSPLFSFTCKNFNVKRSEFCYAGNWTFKLDLGSGDLRSCYFAKPHFNIYDDLNVKIQVLTVGKNCKCDYCTNSSHFLSLGVIPELNTPSYVELRDRDGNWYTEKMSGFLSQKLYHNNVRLTKFQECKMTMMYRLKTGNYLKYLHIRNYLYFIRRKINHE